MDKDEVIEQYKEYLEENELEDSIENINNFVMSLHYEIMDNDFDDSVEETGDEIVKILTKR